MCLPVCLYPVRTEKLAAVQRGYSAGGDGLYEGAPSEQFPECTVVYPTFDTTYIGAGLQSQQQRARLEMGTMHPKLSLLLFRDFLRISISSANIGSYEGGLNQVFWVHDVPRKGSESQAGDHRMREMEDGGEDEG